MKKKFCDIAAKYSCTVTKYNKDFTPTSVYYQVTLIFSNEEIVIFEDGHYKGATDGEQQTLTYFETFIKNKVIEINTPRQEDIMKSIHTLMSSLGDKLDKLCDKLDEIDEKNKKEFEKLSNKAESITNKVKNLKNQNY